MAARKGQRLAAIGRRVAQKVVYKRSDSIIYETLSLVKEERKIAPAGQAPPAFTVR